MRQKGSTRMATGERDFSERLETVMAGALGAFFVCAAAGVVHIGSVAERPSGFKGVEPAHEVADTARREAAALIARFE